MSKRNASPISAEEQAKIMAAIRLEEITRNQTRRDVVAQAEFLRRVAEEKEIRQDRKDATEQEGRGNRVSSSEQEITEWGGILVFALIVLGFILFVRFYIIPIIYTMPK